MLVRYNRTTYATLLKLIGSPDDASLGFLRSNNAQRYVKQLPQSRKQQFSARFPNLSPGAADLLEKMLVFDPNKRITGIVNDFVVSIIKVSGDILQAIQF